MATQTIYISLAGPPPELPDIGPGGSGGAGSAGVGSVLGRTMVIGTSSVGGATLELRVVVNAGSTGQDVNTPLTSGVDCWTSQDIWQALDKIKFVIRQRGFILGSGGPGTVAGTSSGPGTQTINLPI
jgi:hypothetical protein